MKFDQSKAWKMAGKVAAVAALGVVASGQAAQGERHDARKGQALTRVSVSLENDLRTPAPARGKIVLERPDHQLGLVIRIRPRAGAVLDAVMPSIDEMETTLTLENGTPGGVAVIYLGTRALEVRRGGGTRIVGFFDEDGHFPVVLPDGFKAGGVYAQGEEVKSLQNKAAAQGGHAVPISKRPVMENMDVEQTINQAYSNWTRYWIDTYTDLQFRTGGDKARKVRLDDPDLDSGSSASEEEPEVFVEPSPGSGRRALGKIALQRPASSTRNPALGGGHTRPGSGVDDDTDIGEEEEQEVFVELPNPVGGKRAFGKIKLQRPQQPTRVDDHVLQHKL